MSRTRSILGTFGAIAVASTLVLSAQPALAATNAGVGAAAETAAGPVAPTILPGRIMLVGSSNAWRTVTASMSGWQPGGLTFRYQWYAGNKPIRGGTKASLRVPKSAIGHRLRVKITAYKAGFAPTSLTSRASRKVVLPTLPKRCRVKGRVLCASKSARTLFQVKNGRIIGAFDARFGRKGMRTHNGTHRIYWKHRNHTSSQFGTWMPYAQFFYRGEAVHYSPEFVKEGYRQGSHGCINIRSKSEARRLFRWTRTGDRIVVYGRDRGR